MTPPRDAIKVGVQLLRAKAPKANVFFEQIFYLIEQIFAHILVQIIPV